MVWSPFPVTELGPHGAPDAGPLPKAPEKQCPIFYLLEKRVSSHHLGVRESSLFFSRSFNALEKSLLCFKNSTRSKMAQGHQPSTRQSLRPSPHAQLPQRSARLRKASLSLPMSPHITPLPVPPFPRLKRGPDKQPLLSLKLLESCPSLPSNTRRPKISPSAEEPKNCKPLLWSAKDDNSPGDRRLFVRCIILQPLKLITDPRQKQTVKAVTVLEEHICIQKSRQDLFIPAS